MCSFYPTLFTKVFISAATLVWYFTCVAPQQLPAVPWTAVDNANWTTKRLDVHPLLTHYSYYKILHRTCTSTICTSTICSTSKYLSRRGRSAYTDQKQKGVLHVVCQQVFRFPRTCIALKYLPFSCLLLAQTRGALDVDG